MLAWSPKPIGRGGVGGVAKNGQICPTKFQQLAPKRIFLIGFMGCGKTFYGRHLAARLGWNFVDLDEAIEQKAGATIAEIFKTEGAARFRELEQAALRATFSLEETVVATGGGAPVHFENMDEMCANGLVVYLKTPARLLASRLVGETEQRPLIAGFDEEMLREFIGAELARRRRIYGRAHLTVEQRRNSSRFLAKITEKLRPFGLKTH